MRDYLALEFYRSPNGYGWSVTLLIGGKHRARWHSRQGTTRMWPRIHQGSDENCNRSTSLVLWPLGHLDVWWEPNWRTDADGMCDDCRTELAAMTTPHPRPSKDHPTSPRTCGESEREHG